jgi:hypothetical protein
MGSIPIARSITHDDSIGLTHLYCRNLAEKWPFLDPKWTQSSQLDPGVSQKEQASREDLQTYKPDWPAFVVKDG